MLACVGLMTMALSASGPDMNQAASALTTLLVAEVGETKTVLSGEDVRKLLETASNAALAGCDQGAACVAEVASALGTRHVISGRLNQVGSFFVLEATLLDSENGVVIERASLKRASLDELQAGLSDVAARLLAKLPAEAPKVLVMDFETRQTAVIGATTEDVQSSVLSTASFVAGGVGFATLVATYGYLVYLALEYRSLNPTSDFQNPNGVFVPVVGPLLYFNSGTSQFEGVPLIQGGQGMDACAGLQILGTAIGSVGTVAGFLLMPPEPPTAKPDSGTAVRTPAEDRLPRSSIDETAMAMVF